MSGRHSVGARAGRSFRTPPLSRGWPGTATPTLCPAKLRRSVMRVGASLCGRPLGLTARGRGDLSVHRCFPAGGQGRPPRHSVPRSLGGRYACRGVTPWAPAGVEPRLGGAILPYAAAFPRVARDGHADTLSRKASAVGYACRGVPLWAPAGVEPRLGGAILPYAAAFPRVARDGHPDTLARGGGL